MAIQLNIRPQNYNYGYLSLNATAGNVRLAQLETQVVRWTNRLVLEQGALSRSVPDRLSLRSSTPVVGLLPSYGLIPVVELSSISASSNLVRSMLPEDSVVLQVQGVPRPINLMFPQDQSDAIVAALPPHTIQKFAQLKDDRRKVVARTLIFAALAELRRGAILPSDFAFVVAKILDVSARCSLPKIVVSAETPIPGAAPVRKAAEESARYNAIKMFRKQPEAKLLNADQQEVMARIVYRSWEIQIRSRQTTSSFVDFLKNATKTQWTDWVDSAKDQGIALSLLQGWQSQLRRRAGEQSTVVIDILQALPNQAEKQAVASQYFVNGKSLEQSIAQAKNGKPIEIADINASKFSILVEPNVEYRRNQNSLGPKKLHADFSVAAANHLDQLFPGVDWRIDQNPKTKNFVIRSGPTTGKHVLGTVQLPHGSHNVWTITPTNRDYASTSALKQLNLDTVSELNKRYGEGQWYCRPKSSDTIKILSKLGNRPLLVEVKIESPTSQVIVAPAEPRARVSKKADLITATINYINQQVGRTDWTMFATKREGVFEIVDPASQIVFGKLSQTETAKNHGYTPLKRHARPAKDYQSVVGAAFVKQCDEVFGKGTWRLEKAGDSRYQVHRIANLRVPGESYYLGSMSTSNGGVTWSLTKQPGAKKY